MKPFLFAGFFVLIACGGSLSDEQRKKIKEDMKQHKIVRVTDLEITEAAFSKGRAILEKIKSRNFTDARIDSLEDASDVKIKWIEPGLKNAAEIEQQLIEAYLESFINGGLAD